MAFIVIITISLSLSAAHCYKRDGVGARLEIFADHSPRQPGHIDQIFHPGSFIKRTFKDLNKKGFIVVNSSFFPTVRSLRVVIKTIERENSDNGLCS